MFSSSPPKWVIFIVNKGFFKPRQCHSQLECSSSCPSKADRRSDLPETKTVGFNIRTDFFKHWQVFPILDGKLGPNFPFWIVEDVYITLLMDSYSILIPQKRLKPALLLFSLIVRTTLLRKRFLDINHVFSYDVYISKFSIVLNIYKMCVFILFYMFTQ